MEEVSSSKLAWFVLAFNVVAAAAAGRVSAQNTAQDYVNLHNSPRADVGVGTVTWNTTVAVYAQTYAVAIEPCVACVLRLTCLERPSLARVDSPACFTVTNDSIEETYRVARGRLCRLVHSGGPYGENLFWGSAGYAWAASDAVGSWVAEKQYYDHATNTCSAPSGQSCGHYTQVVWRASTAIGCAHVVCSNNAGVFIICNYYPPGNVIGQSPY